jgi:hypothetical protein
VLSKKCYCHCGKRGNTSTDRPAWHSDVKEEHNSWHYHNILEGLKSWIRGLGQALKANKRNYTVKGLYTGNVDVTKGGFKLDMCDV